MKKPLTIITAATIIAVVASAVIVLGTQGKISQNALGQSYGGYGGTTITTAANSIVASNNPNQSTNKEFWINTVHLDGMTNLNAAKFCDTCSQNTPLHPAEKPPVNSTIPTAK